MNPNPSSTHLEPPDQFITDSKGRVFYPQTATEFDIEDIAHSLSMAPRFGGKTLEFYSVAQHSVLVSYLMQFEQLGDPLEGLLHDASEAYLMDLPTPYKTMIPQYFEFEEDLLRRIRVYFQLPRTKSPQCHQADKMAMFMEASRFMFFGTGTFSDPLGVKARACQLAPRYEALLIPKDWRAAKAKFLQRFEELTNG